MNIVHITNLSNNKASGISMIVPEHIKWQSVSENVFWYNINNDFKPTKEVEHIYNGLDKFPDYKISSLPYPFSTPDLVVFHGIYFYQYFLLSKELRRKKIPYIVTPHGSLTELALKQKFVKKKIGFLMFFNKFVKHSKAVQYLTKGEMENSVKKWKNNQIIIPNGCYIPKYYEKKFDNRDVKVIFIGRKSIHYKGLDLLMRAIFLVKNELLEYKIEFFIYGPDENNSAVILGDLIKQYDLNKLVKIQGPVFGEDKREKLAEADVFILTSRTEGHPVALLEALSFGLPSLVTIGTNMDKEINKHDAGWVAESNSESIAKKLLELVKDQSKFAEKSKHAYELASLYEWSNIAKITLDEYKKIVIDR